MKQARVLTDAEPKRLLAVVSEGRFGARNRIAIVFSHMAGLRVGEIAALTIRDVIDSEGKVREQIRLSAAITKGGHALVVFVGHGLRRETERYLRTWEKGRPAKSPLLVTQRGSAFSANTLCQLMVKLYRDAGLDGATSHSGRRWFITKLAHSGVSAGTSRGSGNCQGSPRFLCDSWSA